jgi:ribosomal protein S18 acetylase RimI-like enzyme
VARRWPNDETRRARTSASGGSAVAELEEVAAADVIGRFRSEIEELWRRVFPGTPDERFDETLPRHTARRGFRFLAARTDNGELAGFAYGYEGGPGEWWHDRVAAAMAPEQAEEWLAPGHFEFVELQVAPELEGRGVGGRLHDALLAEARGRTAVLSTRRSNERALGFYRRRGWETIVEEIDFGAGYPPFVVLGKRL